MACLEILHPGLQTTIQDGGRPGHLSKGIPPAGAQDALSLAMANLLVGNDPTPPPLTPGAPGDAGLEMLLSGPTIRFDEETAIALTGATGEAKLNGQPIRQWEAVRVPAGGMLECSRFGPGMRGYLGVAGGLDVPLLLGSRATFVRGSQGGLEGRALRAGDVVRIEESPTPPSDLAGRRIRQELRPQHRPPWVARVVRGPQDELFTDEALELFFSSDWELSPTSDRMGFRFAGPGLTLRARPEYLVRDAGSGPADIVDDVIPVGGVQVAGGVEPIAMGVENPSVGGYAKIATVISADLSILGQIRPGDGVRFREVGLEEAVRIGLEQAQMVGEEALEE